MNGPLCMQVSPFMNDSKKKFSQKNLKKISVNCSRHSEPTESAESSHLLFSRRRRIFSVAIIYHLAPGGEFFIYDQKMSISRISAELKKKSPEKIVKKTKEPVGTTRSALG